MTPAKLRVLFTGLLVLCCSPTFGLEVLGEVYQTSAFAKMDEFGGPKKLVMDDKTKYVIRRRLQKGEETTTAITVSQKTGKIIGVEFRDQFETIHQAMAQAAFVCKGSVDLPESYHWATGYLLIIEQDRPPDLASVWLRAFITVDSFTGRYTVTADFTNADPDNLPPAMKELGQQIIKERFEERFTQRRKQDPATRLRLLELKKSVSK